MSYGACETGWIVWVPDHYRAASALFRLAGRLKDLCELPAAFGNVEIG